MADVIAFQEQGLWHPQQAEDIFAGYAAGFQRRLQLAFRLPPASVAVPRARQRRTAPPPALVLQLALSITTKRGE